MYFGLHFSQCRAVDAREGLPRFKNKYCKSFTQNRNVYRFPLFLSLRIGITYSYWYFCQRILLMRILWRYMYILYNYGLLTQCILYSYRLLMRSNRYHVDRVRYWLTDAVGNLHEIYFNNKETSMALSAASKNRREMRCAYCDVIRKCTPNSSVWAKNWRVNLRFRCDITETPNRSSLSICGVLTLRYGRGKHVSANHEEAKLDKIPDHLINRTDIKQKDYRTCNSNRCVIKCFGASSCYFHLFAVIRIFWWWLN